MREQLGYYDSMNELAENPQNPKSPPRTLAEHKLVTSARALIGANPELAY
jgi:hypothetical protein